MINEFRYKLRTFRIEIDSSADVFCDMKSVTKDTKNPESTLSKKHNVIAYHLCWEAVVGGTVRVAKEDTATNLADLLTKGNVKRKKRGFDVQIHVLMTKEGKQVKTYV